MSIFRVTVTGVSREVFDVEAGSAGEAAAMWSEFPSVEADITGLAVASVEAIR